MQNDGYMNTSAKIGPETIGLGWLDGITAWRTSHAVSMSEHRHPHIELLFCFKGNLVYEIEGHGSVTVSEGTGIVIPANTRHVLKDGIDAPCERLGLHIGNRLDRTRKFGVFTPSDYKTIHSRLKSAAARPFMMDAKLLGSLKELAKLTYGKIDNPAAYGLLRALCCTIIYRTAETLSHPSAAPCPQMMDEAVRFLEENHMRRIGVEDLVRHMGYGRTRLFHLFKQHTGLTPNEYLVRHRVDRAKKLIEDGNLTIPKISAATGFSSESYFRSVFLKYTGTVPESLRIAHRQS